VVNIAFAWRSSGGLSEIVSGGLNLCWAYTDVDEAA
jgi:hypothetical protein